MDNISELSKLVSKKRECFKVQTGHGNITEERSSCSTKTATFNLCITYASLLQEAIMQFHLEEK